MNQRPDADEEGLVAQDQALLTAYGRESSDVPSVAVDEALRAAARRAVQARPRSLAMSRFERLWRMPLAAVATVVLSATVVFLAVRDEGLDRLAQPSRPAASVPSPSVALSSPAESSAPSAESPAPQAASSTLQAAPAVSQAATEASSATPDSSLSEYKALASARVQTGPAATADERRSVQQQDLQHDEGVVREFARSNGRPAHDGSPGQTAAGSPAPVAGPPAQSFPSTQPLSGSSRKSSAQGGAPSTSPTAPALPGGGQHPQATPPASGVLPPDARTRNEEALPQRNGRPARASSDSGAEILEPTPAARNQAAPVPEGSRAVLPGAMLEEEGRAPIPAPQPPQSSESLGQRRADGPPNSMGRIHKELRAGQREELDGGLVSRTAPAAGAASSVSMAPAARVERIRELLREGRRADALRHLQALRAAFPDYALPSDLAELAKSLAPRAR